MLQQDAVPERQAPKNPIEPCWYESKAVSQWAFEEIVKKLNQWFNDYAGLIHFASEQDAIYWVRSSGLTIIYLLSTSSISLVANTLRIKQENTEIADWIDEAMKKLKADGKICTRYSCICQKQFPNCPLMDISE